MAYRTLRHALLLLALHRIHGLSPPPPPTYYVSNSPRGSDAGPGTSPSAPFKTLARASLLRLPPGSSLLLERGSTFADATLDLVLPGAGASLGAFGDPALPRPQIVSRTLPGWVTCVSLVDPGSNFTVSELHLAGCARGVAVSFGKTTVPVTGLTITGCFFRDITGPDEDYTPSGSAWGAAVDLVGGGGAQLGDVVVSHNVGLRIGTFFEQHTPIYGLELESNTVMGCGNNCVGMVSGSGLHLRNSVFLRDTPQRWFMYGTTDVIIGTISGDNSIENSDFNARGEFEGGPDGCAIDFETGATGFNISGNTVFRSWGGGIMVFGHSGTSHNLTLNRNVFLRAGCTQPRNDRAGIAFMCPNGIKPDGEVIGNRFITCPNVPAMFDNPAVPGCSDGFRKEDNLVNGSLQAVAEPQLTFNPPPPTSKAYNVTVPLLAVCDTPHAVVRYTVDGSRPTESSPVLPTKGLMLDFPGPAIAVNVRAFPPPTTAPGTTYDDDDTAAQTPSVSWLPSITNGVVVERYVYLPRGISGGSRGIVRSSFDSASAALEAAPSTPTPTSSVSSRSPVLSVNGWVVDTALPGGGLAPVTVRIDVDGVTVSTVVANASRPDLVKAKIAPNAAHGFNAHVSLQALLASSHVAPILPVAAADTEEGGGSEYKYMVGDEGSSSLGSSSSISSAAAATAVATMRVVDVWAVGSPMSMQPQRLAGSPMCVDAATLVPVSCM